MKSASLCTTLEWYPQGPTVLLDKTSLSVQQLSGHLPLLISTAVLWSKLYTMAALGESLKALDVYNKCAGASALIMLPMLAAFAHSSCQYWFARQGLSHRRWKTAQAFLPSRYACSGHSLVGFLLIGDLLQAPLLVLPDPASLLCQDAQWSFSSSQKLRRQVRS